jgi:hypothetical protein
MSAVSPGVSYALNRQIQAYGVQLVARHAIALGLNMRF